jgi:hypothetical protein
MHLLCCDAQKLVDEAKMSSVVGTNASTINLPLLSFLYELQARPFSQITQNNVDDCIVITVLSSFT